MSAGLERIVRGKNVVTPDGIGPRSVHVARGRIVAVDRYDAIVPGVPLDDVGELALLPGLVDSHVHVNEPGRTEWEGFATATAAAAAGGTTTIVDMPLNSLPPTLSVAALEAKARAAEGKCVVDVGFTGGVVPGNASSSELAAMFGAGALAFKCFLAESGVPEFRHVAEGDLEAALPVLADLGAPLLVHAEHPDLLREGAAMGLDPRSYAAWLDTRPKSAEEAAVAMVIRLTERFRARAHVVHLSAASALADVRKAKDRGVALTIETCPHYLHFASERIPDGATAFKCAPPIREETNRATLWDGLREGLVDQVVTDHSPSTAALKCTGSGDFTKAWGGIASLQLGLAVVWTEARARGLDLAHVVRWMSERPAALVGLSARKGAIAVGRDADLVAFDPEARFPVVAPRLEHKNKVTPYDGEELRGCVRTTWLRGQTVYDRGNFPGTPRGERMGKSNV